MKLLAERAFMETEVKYGLTHILTFNIADFARYSQITAVNPPTVKP